MRWGAVAVALGVVIVVWGSAIAAWRWTVSRLGLKRPDSPIMGEREKVVRRSLRALLAFDFLVLWPVGIPATIAGIALGVQEHDLLGPGLGALLGLGLMTAAVPSLVRTARRLERQRLAGEPEDTRPSLWIEGRFAPIDGDNTAGARWGRIALIASLLVGFLLNWRVSATILLLIIAVAMIRFAWTSVIRGNRN
jgi:hypothetical protein